MSATGNPRLPTIAFIVVSVVFTGGVALHTGDSAAWTAFGDIGQTLAPIVAAAACWWSARSKTGQERRGWLWIALACGSSAIGQALWTIDEVVLGVTPPTPSLPDAGYLSSPLLMVAGVLCFVDTPTGRLSRSRGVLEALMFAGGLILPTWFLLLAPTWQRGTEAEIGRAINLAYPVFDVIVLGAVLFVLTRRRVCSARSLWLLVAAIVMLAFADTSYWYLNTLAEYQEVQLADAGWFVGFLLVALACLAGPDRKASTAMEGELVLHRSWVVTATPEFVLLCGTAAVSIHSLVTSGGFSEATAWLVIAAFVVALTHGLVVAMENHALTFRLEERIAQRTAELVTGKRHFAALVEHSSDIVAVVDPDLRFISVSDAGRTIYGWEPEHLVGTPLDEHGGQFVALADMLRSADIEAGAVRQLRWELVDSNGLHRFAESKVRNLLDDPDVRAYVINTRDVTDQTSLETQLRHQAFHDELSGLANRALFNDRTGHALARADRTGTTVAVAVIDLDGFKDVNDSLGHHAGDQLLSMVGRRLVGVSRGGDTVARLGGDEFAVLMEDIDDPDEAIAAAERLRAAICRRLTIDANEIAVTASIGVSLSTTTSTVGDLIRDADIAMYIAKKDGKDSERVFEPWMREQARERFELLSELPVAVERNEFVLHYQPVFAIEAAKLEGFEALLRWNHPLRGLIPPDEFIPLAEESGMIVPLGRWVLGEAIGQLKTWDRMGAGPSLTMAINLSVRQLRHSQLVGDVRDALASSGVDPERIVLEITETMLIHDPKEIAEVMHELKALGVRLAIDDFATGYSSLSFLKDLPVDLLKVDKTFVSPPEDQAEESGKLLAAILNIADCLGIGTIAEGVEDVDQADLLRDLGCDVGQGHLWAPALSAAEATKLVDRALLGEPGTGIPGSGGRRPKLAGSEPR